jgi:hypothetical protein
MEKQRTVEMLEEEEQAEPPVWRHSGDEKEPESTGAGNR